MEMEYVHLYWQKTLPESDREAQAMLKQRSSLSVGLPFCYCALALVMFSVAFAPVSLLAQNGSSSSQDSAGQQNANPQKQAPPPEAGGPQSDTGPYALPKVDPDKPANRPAPPPAPKPTEGMPS